jgi:hypothetical protein
LSTVSCSTRSDRRGDGDVARHVDERADDDEAREAQRQRVADVRIERNEQRRIDECIASLLEAAPLLRRRRGDLAVERVAVGHGAHL